MMTFGSIVRGALVTCLLAATASGAGALEARSSARQQAPSPAGAWAGRISLPPGPLEIAVAFAQDATTRAWSGSIDIPAQGAKGLPLGGIAIDGRTVAFGIAGVPGKPTFTPARYPKMGPASRAPSARTAETSRSSCVAADPRR